MSSTLAKKAESPGVLITFWRMIVVSIVWNLLLTATGRRVHMADVDLRVSSMPPVPGAGFCDPSRDR